MTPTGAESWSMYTEILCWIIFPVTVVIIALLSRPVAALLPVILLPSVCFWLYEQSREMDKRANLEVSLWTFFLAGTVGITVVGIIQSILSYGFALLLFRSKAEKYITEFMKQSHEITDPEHIATRRAMARKWQYWVSLVLMAYVVAAGMEECLKYVALLLAQRYGSATNPRHYTTYAVAAALGFSTSENIGFIYGATKAESGWRLAVIVFERVALGPTVHGLAAAFIGLGVMKQALGIVHVGIYQIMILPILYHGTFDFLVMAVSARNGNIGWVHPWDRASLVTLFTFAITMSLTGALILQFQIGQLAVHNT